MVFLFIPHFLLLLLTGPYTLQPRSSYLLRWNPAPLVAQAAPGRRPFPLVPPRSVLFQGRAQPEGLMESQDRWLWQKISERSHYPVNCKQNRAAL